MEQTTLQLHHSSRDLVPQTWATMLVMRSANSVTGVVTMSSSRGFDGFRCSGGGGSSTVVFTP